MSTAVINELVEKIWSKYDLNKDGFLSKQEAKEFFNNQQTGTIDEKEFFNVISLIDENQDNKISKKEMFNFIQTCLSSGASIDEIKV